MQPIHLQRERWLWAYGRSSDGIALIDEKQNVLFLARTTKQYRERPNPQRLLRRRNAKLINVPKLSASAPMRPVDAPSRQSQLLSVPISGGFPVELLFEPVELLLEPLELPETHTLSDVHGPAAPHASSDAHVISTVWTLNIAGSASGGILPAQFTTPTQNDRS